MINSCDCKFPNLLDSQIRHFRHSTYLALLSLHPVHREPHKLAKFLDYRLSPHGSRCSIGSTAALIAQHWNLAAPVGNKKPKLEPRTKEISESSLILTRLNGFAKCLIKRWQRYGDLSIEILVKWQVVIACTAIGQLE
ncbi:MAG: hypothetical protein ACJAQU_000332 [Loktanella salsilacus]|jgi:hypothetical protein